MTLIGARHCASQLRNVTASIRPIRFASSCFTRRCYENSLWTKVAVVSGFSAAGLWLYFNHVHCASTSREARSAPTPAWPFKSVKLYEYRFSPYCSKTRAFMEYYGIPYETVELNPLWKRRMNLSSNKIPIAEVDGEKMDDSSLIISALRTCMLTGRNIRDTLLYYPEMTVTNSNGTSGNERVNKYVVMYNDTPDALELVKRRCCTVSISKVWIREGVGLICEGAKGVSVMQHGHLTPLQLDAMNHCSLYRSMPYMARIT